MSATRWRSAWKVEMVTPNCLRWFMYSVVSFSVCSIAPTPSAHRQAMPMSTACVSAVRPSVVIRVAGALSSLTSAARASSCVR